MFEYLFPIFAFGVLISAIVAKGIVAAADETKEHRLAIAPTQTGSLPESRPEYASRARKAA